MVFILSVVSMTIHLRAMGHEVTHGPFVSIKKHFVIRV